MRAINSFIFGGSATIGTEKAGFEVDRVLEMTDNMHELNAYHFVRNRPDIPLVPPSVWENEEYLNELKNEDFDFSFNNCPCSGLSLANRKASVDAEINQQFFRVSGWLKHVQPKAFVVENAPTLLSFGTPILQQFIRDLDKTYKFTVLRDQAGNHGVAMKRARAMIVGWRRDYFEDSVPQVLMRKNENGEYTLRHAFEGISQNTPNYFDQPEQTGLEFLIPGAVAAGHSVDMEAALNIEKYEKQLKEVSETKYNGIVRLAERMKVKAIWDKSPAGTNWDDKAGSMTSYTRHIHPDGERFMSIREYASLMGYPQDFVFYEGGRTPIVQCIAQGVPVNFVRWIAEEAKRNIKEPTYLSKTADVIFQNNINEQYEEFSFAEFDALSKVELSKKSKVLRDERVHSSIDNFF